MLTPRFSIFVPSAPHLVCQFCEVLSCLLYNEAQPEDGTVWVRVLIKRAMLQVVTLLACNVAPKEQQKTVLYSEHLAPSTGLHTDQALAIALALRLTWRT